MRDALAHAYTRRWHRRLRDFILFPLLMLNPSRRRANLLYEAVSTANWLTDETLFRNVGYWKHSPANLDDASEALVQFAGEAAELKSTDCLLDAGYGFGDQDMYWAEHFSPRQIVGLNITRSQVELARERVAAQNLSDHVELMLAPATQMPLETASFDKVIALESAFHFPTREDFFREALRVLKPGGRLVTLDMVPLPDQKIGPIGRLVTAINLHFWQIPAKNMYDRRVYAEKLQGTGFEVVDVRSVRDETLVPFCRYSFRQLARRVIHGKMDFTFAVMIALTAVSILWNPFRLVKFDYILAVADKPHASCA